MLADSHYTTIRLILSAILVDIIVTVKHRNQTLFTVSTFEKKKSSKILL